PHAVAVRHSTGSGAGGETAEIARIPRREHPQRPAWGLPPPSRASINCTRGGSMRKILGLGLALVLTLPLSAAAEGIMGKVKAVDPADHSIVLDDGTKLWVSEDHLTDLAPGDQVQATYEMQGGKRIITDLDHRTIGSDGQGTTNFFSRQPSPIDTIQ